MVRFEKPDFVGKPALLAARQRGLSNKLVGFVTEELVEEGSVIVVDRQPVGRVTSARFSPLHQRCVGMAWVPLQFASEGTAVEIQSNEGTVTARVHEQPFYDPAGARLKE